MSRLKIRVMLLLSAPLLLNSESGMAHGKNQHQAQTSPWVIPAQLAQRPSPLADAPFAATSGEALFTMYCAACHGDKNRGSSFKQPVDLARASGNSSVGELAYKIALGRGEMPGWELVLTDTNIWELVAYLQTLSPVLHTRDTPTKAAKRLSLSRPSTPKQELSTQ